MAKIIITIEDGQRPDQAGFLVDGDITPKDGKNATTAQMIAAIMVNAAQDEAIRRGAGFGLIDDLLQEAMTVLIGKTKVEAVEWLTTRGVRWRVCSRNGNKYVTTADHDKERVNLWLENDTIVKITTG